MKFSKLRAGLVSALVLGLSLSATSFAESNSTTTNTQNGAAAPAGQTAATAQAPQAPTSKFFGTLDLRAEYYSLPGIWDTSNFAQFGYQINPDFLISWYQGFDSNLYKATLSGVNVQGLSAVWDQGFLRTRVNNIWKSTDGAWAINYESRIYVPTWKTDSDANNITRFYNAFKLAHKVSDVVTLTAVDVVMPQVFSTAGTAAGGPNPWFENRVYFVADFQFTPWLSLDLPLLLYMTANRVYGDGPKSGNWSYLLYTWPELDFALNDNVTLGIAYISGNFVKSDLSGLDLSNALKNSVVQFAFTANL